MTKNENINFTAPLPPSPSAAHKGYARTLAGDGKIVILFLSLLLLCCNSISDKKTTTNYIGAWYWKSRDSSSSFKIIFVKKGDSIIGQYCAAYNFGNRLDCDFDKIYNLRGKIGEDSILLNFHSFYGAENGIAVIKRKEDELEWKIIKWPIGGDCFAPEIAIMYRYIKDWE